MPPQRQPTRKRLSPWPRKRQSRRCDGTAEPSASEGEVPADSEATAAGESGEGSTAESRSRGRAGRRWPAGELKPDARQNTRGGSSALCGPIALRRDPAYARDLPRRRSCVRKETVHEFVKYRAAGRGKCPPAGNRGRVRLGRSDLRTRERTEALTARYWWSSAKGGGHGEGVWP